MENECAIRFGMLSVMPSCKASEIGRLLRGILEEGMRLSDIDEATEKV